MITNIFSDFFYRMEAYMENNEDALLREDEEGTPESGKNTAPSQCNERMALLASMNKTMAAMSESLLGKGATHSGHAEPQNGRMCRTKT